MPQRSQQTRLPWRVSDDYGVVVAAGRTAAARPAAMRRRWCSACRCRAARRNRRMGVNQQDLTAHPWAGLPVIARLVARDALGQAGESKEAEFVLPERPFQNPIARALMAIRRGSACIRTIATPRWRAGCAADAARGVRRRHRRLPQPGRDLLPAGAQQDARRPSAQAQQRMWELALHLEEGRTERTARALEEARQAAREALDRATASRTRPTARRWTRS